MPFQDSHAYFSVARHLPEIMEEVLTGVEQSWLPPSSRLQGLDDLGGRQQPYGAGGECDVNAGAGMRGPILVLGSCTQWPPYGCLPGVLDASHAGCPSDTPHVLGDMVCISDGTS